MKRFLTFKKFFPFLAIAGVSVIFLPMTFKLFGTWSWRLLLIIVFSRPLADIFPMIKPLRLIVAMRKEIGIVCAAFGIAHGAGFFLAYDLNVFEGLFSSASWSLMSVMGSGLWACAIMLPLLLTSNIVSMRRLGKYWKRIQRLTYIFFLLVVFHIAIVKHGAYLAMGSIALAWSVLWILAYKRITFTEYKKTVISAIILIGAAIVGAQVYTDSQRPERGERPQEGTGQVLSGQQISEDLQVPTEATEVDEGASE